MHRCVSANRREQSEIWISQDRLKTVKLLCIRAVLDSSKGVITQYVTLRDPQRGGTSGAERRKSSQLTTPSRSRSRSSIHTRGDGSSDATRALRRPSALAFFRKHGPP